MISAKVILHTKSMYSELITVEVDLHRFILAQMNTHRSLSRNYQSSRAVPVLKQIEQVINNPALPVYYGKNQSGMVADGELPEDTIEECKEKILKLRDTAVETVNELQELGLAKEIANRYIEPWLSTKGIITATREAWEAFFELRCEDDAQKEISTLAKLIRSSVQESRAILLHAGEWHLPYLNYSREEGTGVLIYSLPDGSEVPVSVAIKASIAAAAQVSYRSLDLSLEKVYKIYDMLKLPENGDFSKGTPHFSPAEHVAMACYYEHIVRFLDPEFETTWHMHYSGNFHTEFYCQYRKILEYGFDTKL